MTLLIGVVRFTMSDGRAKGGSTRATQRLGFHDIREEPPYFWAGFLFAYAAIVIGTRVWAIFELGAIA